MVAPNILNVGDRLRRQRQAAGLTLHDVERITDGEFKASALGAYERGERVLSVPRLCRLAEILGVNSGEILGTVAEVDLIELHEEEERRTSSTSWDQAAVMMLTRFSAHIRSTRRTPVQEPLCIRDTDCDLMAILIGTDALNLREMLAALGMRAGRQRSPRATVGSRRAL